MIVDTIDRYWHSIGKPPDRMIASLNLKWEFLREQPPYVVDEITQMPTYRFYYNGVEIDCLLNTQIPTLVAVCDG